MSQKKLKSPADYYASHNKKSRIRFWWATLLSFLSAYLLKASTSLNTPGTIMYYALMQVALAFIKRRVKIKNFKINFVNAVAIKE